MKARLCDSCGEPEARPYLVQLRDYKNGKLSGVIKAASIDLCKADLVIFANDLKASVEQFKEERP